MLKLYTLWFMGLLALLFFAALLSQFIRPLPFAAVSLTIFALAFGALAIPDTDAFIAEHNYNCYISGEKEDFDIGYLENLGDSAIPTVVKLINDPDEELAKEARRILGVYGSEHYGYGFYDLTLPAIKAKKAYDGLSAEVKDDCVAIAAEYAEREDA